MAHGCGTEPNFCSCPVILRSMTAPGKIQTTRNAANTDERGEYLIDGFRVSFLHQAEWNCDCREFSVVGTCRHTREAVGMREAQASIRRRTRPRLARLNQRTGS